MKGFLMKTDMIKAIVERRKTVTRRVLKIKGVDIQDKKWVEAKYHQKYNVCFINDGIRETWGVSPRYQVGEVVYIKEAWWQDDDGDVFYKSDWIRPDGSVPQPSFGKWKSPLFLPEKFARYFIKITDVRAERLQEITEEEAIAEGIPPFAPNGKVQSSTIPRKHFATLWDTINKPPYDWQSNPWVWRYEFEEVSQ